MAKNSREKKVDMKLNISIEAKLEMLKLEAIWYCWLEKKRPTAIDYMHLNNYLYIKKILYKSRLEIGYIILF